MRAHLSKKTVGVLLGLSYLVFACVVQAPNQLSRHRWWSGLGPVLPHDSFPADCGLCHEGNGWDTLTKNFEFDHASATGVELTGAHAQARCLRCHNDRGPVGSVQLPGLCGLP